MKDGRDEGREEIDYIPSTETEAKVSSDNQTPKSIQQSAVIWKRGDRLRSRGWEETQSQPLHYIGGFLHTYCFQFT